MRPALPRIFESRAGNVVFPSTLRLRLVRRVPSPRRGTIEGWEILVLVLMALVLVGVGRDGVDLARIPFTGWMHP
jgi:hypothetical protein